LADGREVADEGDRRPDCQAGPDGVLGRAQQQFARAHRALVQLQAGQMVAFDLGLDPGEDRRINCLRAGKAAEQATGQRGDEEQAGRRQDQRDGQ